MFLYVLLFCLSCSMTGPWNGLFTLDSHQSRQLLDHSAGTESLSHTFDRVFGMIHAHGQCGLRWDLCITTVLKEQLKEQYSGEIWLQFRPSICLSPCCLFTTGVILNSSWVPLTSFGWLNFGCPNLCHQRLHWMLMLGVKTPRLCLQGFVSTRSPLTKFVGKNGYRENSHLKPVRGVRFWKSSL